MDGDRHRGFDAEDAVDAAAGAGHEDLSASIAYDPLERVCLQLDFEHSLTLDADELRRLVTVLDHVAVTRMRNIVVFERCAANSSGQRASRLRALAARLACIATPLAGGPLESRPYRSRRRRRLHRRAPEDRMILV